MRAHMVPLATGRGPHVHACVRPMPSEGLQVDELRRNRFGNLVLAATFQHAGLVAEYLGLGPRDWTFVHVPMKMNGHRDSLVFVYDTLEWRKDFPELADRLERYEAINPGLVRIITEDMLCAV